MEKKDDKKGQWIKNLLGKWYFLAIASVVFLVGVQVAFVIPAPNKWFDAAWEAGDFISFVGTIILGYIAMRQTQRANKMAEDANDVAKNANETSRRLIQLQEEEYIPVVTVSSFAGMSKYNIEGERSSFQAEMVAVQMRDENDNVSVGYSLAILAEGSELEEKTYCRAYEIHFVYSGHFVMSSFVIKSIAFRGKDFEKKYPISNAIAMSLCDKEKLTLQVFLLCNEDFIKKDSDAYNYIKAGKFIIEVEMTSMQGKAYTENIVIEKTLVEEPEPVLKKPYIELKLSATYQVEKK